MNVYQTGNYFYRGKNASTNQVIYIHVNSQYLPKMTVEGVEDI